MWKWVYVGAINVGALSVGHHLHFNIFEVAITVEEISKEYFISAGGPVRS